MAGREARELDDTKGGMIDKPLSNHSLSNRKRVRILLLVLMVILIAVGIAVIIVVAKSAQSCKTKEIIKDLSIKVVNTNCGQVEGKLHQVITDNGQKKGVYEFRNIPYSVPPLGELRWRPPKPLSKDTSTCWNGTLKYNKSRIECKQSRWSSRIINTEDCLVVTVRTPYAFKDGKKLPVLFWIHGGSLIVGSNGNEGYFPDEQFGASMGVVSVSVNYRLNIFGFLSLEELWIKSGPDQSYGNYGILDQILALKWIQENIENFGGDTKNVIILGNSGGGKAVKSLVVSPLAQGLFQKAITSSGYPNDIKATYQLANERYRVFVNDTGCNKTTEPDEIARCLRNLDADFIVKKLPWTLYPEIDYWNFPNNEKTNEIFTDVIDPVVQPETIGRNKDWPKDKMDIFIGYTSQEGLTQYFANSWEGLHKVLKPRVDSFQKGYYQRLIELYTEKREGKTSPQKITPQYVYTTMTSDVLLSCQLNEIARNISTLPNLNVYMYVVSQPNSPQYGENFTQSSHGWDTDALFGIHGLRFVNSQDQKLMLQLRDIFKKFINSKLTEYKDKTIEFWNNTIYVWDHDYHDKECNVLKDIGALNRAWGQLGE